MGELDARISEAHSKFERRGNHCIYMKVDISQVGLVRGVAHELLHAVLRAEMRAFDPCLEELAVRAWEGAVVASIESSEHKTRVWRNAIALKVEER